MFWCILGIVWCVYKGYCYWKERVRRTISCFVVINSFTSVNISMQYMMYEYDTHDQGSHHVFFTWPCIFAYKTSREIYIPPPASTHTQNYTLTRMDQINPPLHSHIRQTIDIQIRTNRIRRRSSRSSSYLIILQHHILIGKLHVRRIDILGSTHCYRMRAQCSCRPSDADGDFASVGNEDFTIGE